MTLAVAVKVPKSSPNNEVIDQIVVVVSLDLVDVNVIVMIDTAVVTSMVKVADRDCREKASNVSALASANGLLTFMYRLLIKSFIHLVQVIQ